MHIRGVYLWSLGIFLLAILAALIVLVGARNEYGDRDHDGFILHIYFVYGIGLLYFLIPFCMLKGLGETLQWARRTILILAIIWSVAAPIFFLIPTGYDGLYERLLGLLACAIISTLSIAFLRMQKPHNGNLR
jgi:peptidoglycan/LPS O-acetylase OafA/YrhL